MKNFEKICLSLSLAVVSILQASAATSVTIIDVIDSKTVGISFSSGAKLSDGILKGEVKILQDIEVASSQVSPLDTNSVVLELSSPVQALTEYSVLTVFGKEGSIDFTTGTSTASGTTFQNTTLTQGQEGITSISLEGNSRLKIVYSTKIVSEEFEYKILAGVPVVSLEKKKNDSRVSINLGSDLKAEQDYILMMLSLQDANNAALEFDGGIYDFSSPKVLEISVSRDDISFPESAAEPIIAILGEQVDTSLAKTTIQEKIAKRNAASITASQATIKFAQNTTTSQEPEIELNAAAQETGFIKDVVLTDVALAAETMPKAGAETWILVFMSIVINAFFYSTRLKRVETY